MKKEKGYIFKTDKGDAKVIDYICYVDATRMNECYDVYLCQYNNNVAVVKVYSDDWDFSDIPILDKIINEVGYYSPNFIVIISLTSLGFQMQLVFNIKLLVFNIK